ncbi:DEAD/DEAH box helicase [Anaerobacillus alkaliphilus]|uniref:DEAD/DEAH box helicase n=1 Tax=Anaerobacillus alkaliphilus TaxID=1548597 RepID=A0A4Q0VPD5_9BACI|nr:DEAD/DEAH box helicase [Anaerobacillus alkaliphilus]RXI98316.1 DEAD/DEAH box helicase [Anaerobacillus alkaliphilus]
MINNYNPNPIIVHAGILKGKGSYSLVVWGEQKKHKKYVDIEPFKYPFLYSPFELKLALFRSHQASFYGTFLPTCECHIQVPLDQRLFYSEAGNVPVYHVPANYEHHLFPIQGLEISLNESYSFISTLINITNNEEWQLADDFLFIQILLKTLLNEIKSGNLLPNPNGLWDLPTFQFADWLEAVPPSLLSLIPVNSSLIDKANEKTSLREFCLEFVNQYLTHILNTDPNVVRAYKELNTSQTPAIKTMLASIKEDAQMTTSHEIHQQFLESIGAVEVAPFKLGLRVEEDRGTDLWNLTLFIQDRVDQTLMIDVADLLVGKHPWRDNPITFFKDVLQKGKSRIELFQRFSLSTPSIKVSIDEAYELVASNDLAFQELGLAVLVPSWWNKKEDHFAVTLKQKDIHEIRGTAEPLLNWQAIADFDYSISVAGLSVTEQEFQELVNHKRPIVKLRGKWVFWDVNAAQQIQSKIEAYKNKKKLTYIEAFQLQLQEENEKNIRWEAHWNKKITTMLSDLTKHSWDKAPIPQGLNGSLRPYQHAGFSWLLNMRKIGFGACLADDMGLGKTIQTISYLLAVKELYGGKLKHPYLLICPTSLIGNWEDELHQFAPSLKVYVHHGQQRSTDEELLKTLTDVDIVITSYSLAVRDEVIWTGQPWETLILDEAQHIKNIETKQRRSIKEIEAVHRIALTGTPIENRLKELWSIIDLLNDHFLGSYQQFSKVYIKEIEGVEQSNEKLNELRVMISPFLLRRTKQDKHIHLQLPSKSEIVHRVGLTVEQASLYQAVINDLFDRIDTVSEMERRALILSSLTKLKQICNHPAHYLKDGGNLENRSEKWEELILLCETIASNQEKALIFTQYKEMGTLIQKGLNEMFDTEIPFLHGSLQRHKREELIWKFMNEDVPFFILSLKAGGVGLNLTAATHVIHYDRWWNPAVENQATDRAYRIGQTEDVTVHKLLTKGTLEEKIHQMLEKKQALSDQILNTNENKMSELTTDELEHFLKLRISSLS